LEKCPRLSSTFRGWSSPHCAMRDANAHWGKPELGTAALGTQILRGPRQTLSRPIVKESKLGLRICSTMMNGE
jgi:hypothetical protein